MSSNTASMLELVRRSGIFWGRSAFDQHLGIFPFAAVAALTSRCVVGLFWEFFSRARQLFQIAEMTLVNAMHSPSMWKQLSRPEGEKKEGAPASREDECVVKIKI